jgi:hypothetical protein
MDSVEAGQRCGQTVVVRLRRGDGQEEARSRARKETVGAV